MSSSTGSLKSASTHLARLAYENQPLPEFQTLFAQWKDPSNQSRLKPAALEAFNDGPTLRDVVDNDRADLVPLLLSLGFETTTSVISVCLRRTRETRRVDILDMLLSGGWDINRPVNEYCPPAMSLLLNHTDLVHHCLALNASPNASSPSGHTNMHRSVTYAPLSTTHLLVAYGATVQGTNLLAHAICAYTQPNSSLSQPQWEDRLPTIHYLLEQGALVDASYSAILNPAMQTGDGIFYGTMTALHFAIAGEKVELVRLLLERGAQVSCRAWSGWKTEGREVDGLELARICGGEEMVGVLEEWMAVRACP